MYGTVEIFLGAFRGDASTRCESWPTGERLNAAFSSRAVGDARKRKRLRCCGLGCGCEADELHVDLNHELGLPTVPPLLRTSVSAVLCLGESHSKGRPPGALARLGWGAALLCASEGLIEVLVAPRHAPLDAQVI